MRRAARVILVLAALVGGATAAFGYAFLGSRWPDGSIVMQLQLGSSGTLSDGSSSWGSSFEGALAEWNGYLSRVSFRVVRDSTAAKARGNNLNNVFWSSSVYGSSFDDALAVTTRNTSGTTRVEADIIFNTYYNWNSYRGALKSGTADGRTYDFRRVALHESGHALGLDHPDDHGQSVSAIMHSTTSNVDSLTIDDITGVQVLYAGTTTVTVTAPGAPSGMTASASGSTVTLRWTAPTTGGTPTSYIIEAGSSPGATNLANFSTGSTATSFSSSGVGSGVYYVRVRASNSAGTSAASSDAVLTVGSGCTSGPAAPSGLRIVSNVGGTVVLAWTASASGTPTTYIVEAGSSPGGANLANSDLGGTSTSLTALNVGRGTYYVRIRGKNACGVGSASNEIVLVVA